MENAILLSNILFFIFSLALIAIIYYLIRAIFKQNEIIISLKSHSVYEQVYDKIDKTTPEEDRKREAELKDRNDYISVFMRGEATDDEEKRFGEKVGA